MTPFKNVPGIKACAIQTCSTPMVHFETTTISESLQRKERHLALEIGLTKHHTIQCELACEVTECLMEEVWVEMWKREKRNWKTKLSENTKLYSKRISLKLLQC